MKENPLESTSFKKFRSPGTKKRNIQWELKNRKARFKESKTSMTLDLNSKPGGSQIRSNVFKYSAETWLPPETPAPDQTRNQVWGQTQNHDQTCKFPKPLLSMSPFLVNYWICSQPKHRRKPRTGKTWALGETGHPSQKQGEERLHKGGEGESQNGSRVSGLVATNPRSEQEKGSPEGCASSSLPPPQKEQIHYLIFSYVLVVSQRRFILLADSLELVIIFA